VFQDALINLGNVLQLLIKMSIRNGASSASTNGVLLSADVKVCCAMFLDILKSRIDGTDICSPLINRILDHQMLITCRLLADVRSLTALPRYVSVLAKYCAPSIRHAAEEILNMLFQSPANASTQAKSGGGDAILVRPMSQFEITKLKLGADLEALKSPKSMSSTDLLHDVQSPTSAMKSPQSEGRGGAVATPQEVTATAAASGHRRKRSNSTSGGTSSSVKNKVSSLIASLSA
jgi:hypothetical protein